MGRYNFSLLHKAVIAIVAILLPIFITFLIGYNHNKNEIKKSALSDLTVLAESFEGQVYLYLDSLKSRAIDFASDGFIRDELEKINAGKDPFDLNNHLIKNKISLDKDIVEISIATLGGRIAASTRETSIGSDVSDSRSFILGKDSTIITNSMHEKSLDDHINISSPLVSKSTGETIGVLINHTHIHVLNSILSGRHAKELGALSSGQGRARTMEVYLVNQEKLMITDSIFIDSAILTQQVNTVPVRKCLERGQEAASFYPDYRGVPVAGASMCFKELGWTLLTEVDVEEALLPLAKLKRDALVTILLVFAIILFIFILFYKKVIKPLRRMASAADEIGMGSFDVTLPTTSSDEIGSLSSSVNVMAYNIKGMTEALTESQKSLAEAHRIACIGSFEWNIATGTILFSDEAFRLFDTTPKSFTPTMDGLRQMIDPDDLEHFNKALDDALSAKETFSLDLRLANVKGVRRTLHMAGEISFTRDAVPLRMIVTIQDITARKQTEEELKTLSTAIDQSVNLVVLTDKDSNIEFVNKKFEEVTGYTREEIIGMNPNLLSSGETSPETYKEMWSTILDGRIWSGEIKNKKKDGDFYHCTMNICPIKNDRGQTTHFLAIQEDITDKKSAEETIEYLDTYSKLTGLINRSRFIELLNEWVAYAHAPGQSTVLLFLNIDQFRLLNDTYGHATGDLLLRKVAHLIKEALTEIERNLKGSRLRESIVGYMGADEFAIFLPSSTEGQGLDAAEEIRNRLEGLRVEDVDVRTTVSTGGVIFPKDGMNIKALFTKADAALMRAKGLGGNRCHFYRHEDRDLEQMHSRLKGKEIIQKALAEDRIEPWYQPLLNLEDGKITHYEALIRIREKDGRILYPGEFIATAEIFGLIGSLDRAMIAKTLKLQAELRAQGRLVSFGMNLSGKEMGDMELISFVKNKIEETGADPSSLVFEITETEAISDLKSAIEFVNALRELGCKFALDDFGVGFTSFLYLKELHVDYIKIDGYFIKKLHESVEDQLFVKAITSVAEGMGIKSIAEFVEEPETLSILSTYGVDYAQGYLIGKPSPELLAETIILEDEFNKKTKA